CVGAAIAQPAGAVVIAAPVFPATAVVVQPLTGLVLVYLVGYSPFESWIVLSILLYVAVGACWLPVVRIQLLLRDLARKAAGSGGGLPPRYHRLLRLWFFLGSPAFAGVVLNCAVLVWKAGL